MFSLLLIYLLVGSVVGILAGLFGVGGGVVIVPMLNFCFLRQNVPQENIMLLALGTSMGSIIFTSISSFLSHHKRKAVHWDIVKKIVPGILIGTFLGSCIASNIPNNFLKYFFLLFLYYVSIQMLIDKKPKASRVLPKSLGMFLVGNVIGVISSLVGIGGGSLSVPFMVWCNIPIHHAIGTSSAIGFPIAIAGTLGYIYNGINIQNLPNYSVGYIYLPALLGIVCASVITAPLGAKIAHNLPISHLKRIFAIFLIFVGIKMYYEL